MDPAPVVIGYFSGPPIRRPFVRALLRYPAVSDRGIEIEFLLDTGSDGSALAPSDARRLGIDIESLPVGALSMTVGGTSETRSADAIMALGSFTFPLSLAVLGEIATELELPSLLGRDVLSLFALFMEERTERLLLLEPREAAQLALP